MHIAPPLENFQFQPNSQEIEPLRDVYRIFGGGIFYSRQPFGPDAVAYSTTDQRVQGESSPLGGISRTHSFTTLRVCDLQVHTQAARWTVIKAYEAKYYERYETSSLLKSIPFGVVIPDQPAMQAPVAPDKSTPKIYKICDPNLDSEVTVLQAQERDLWLGAQTIAAYYSEHLPLPELDSSIAVAYALGATSMNQLEDAWREAMAQPDPYAAAVAASKTLLYEL